MNAFYEFFNQRNKKWGSMWWMGSYSVILILSIILNLIGYNVSLRIVNDEVEKNNKAALENIRLTIDNYFDNVRSGAFSILGSDVVTKIERGIYSDHDRSVWINVLISNINKQNTQQPLYNQNTTVIFRNKDMCIQPSLGVCDLETAYSINFKDAFDTKEAWINRAFSVPGAECMVAVLPTNRVKVYLIYYVPTIHKDVAVITDLSDAYFNELLIVDKFYNEKNLIVDENGRVLFANDSNMLGTGINIKENSFQTVINSEDYIISTVQSKATQFYYVKMVPAKIYLKGIKKVRFAFITGFILCIIIVEYIAYIFTKLNNRRRQILDNELQKHKAYVRSEAFKRILSGDVNNVDEEFVQEYRFILKNKYYVVALFDLLLYDMDDEAQNFDDEYYENLYSYLLNAIEKNLTDLQILSCRTGDSYACLICFDGSANLKNISERINDVCENIKKEIKVNICCCMSKINDEFDKIHESYEQALEVSGFRFLGDMKTVSLYEDMIVDYSLQYYSVDNEKYIIDLIMLGQYDETVEFIERLFQYAFKNLPINTLRMFMADLVNILIKAMSKIDANASLNIQPLYDTLFLMGNLSKVHEVKSIIFDFVRKLCDIRNESKKNSEEKDKKYHEIAKYIEEHYSDPMLDVNMLANEFNINRSYLSTKFREEMGVGLSDYIVQCRINKAKELLKTDMSINQIAQQVGFSSKVVYCRAFKKYENITSMQYRKLVNSNVEDCAD